MKGTMKRNPVLARVRTEIRILEKARKNQIVDHMQPSDKPLLELLPGREVVEPLVRLYLDTYNHLYHILHLPSFWKEYYIFWDAPKKGRLGFVATLLLVMAVVGSISNQQRFNAGDTEFVARESAVTWILASETWLQAQSQKHLTLNYFQICCLSLLAKRSNVIKAKRYWTSAGTLLRFAISTGLHRDPSHLGDKITVFDAEMKRRIWTTIVELELQASIDR